MSRAVERRIPLHRRWRPGRDPRVHRGEPIEGAVPAKRVSKAIATSKNRSDLKMVPRNAIVGADADSRWSETLPEAMVASLSICEAMIIPR